MQHCIMDLGNLNYILSHSQHFFTIIQKNSKEENDDIFLETQETWDKRLTKRAFDFWTSSFIVMFHQKLVLNVEDVWCVLCVLESEYVLWWSIMCINLNNKRTLRLSQRRLLLISFTLRNQQINFSFSILQNNNSLDFPTPMKCDVWWFRREIKFINDNDERFCFFLFCVTKNERNEK